MDSPEPDKTSTTATAATAPASLSNSPPVQESPFSNFISTLSPIKPDKGAHLPHGFVGLSSPPFVFTSPRIPAHREASLLQRSILPRIAGAGIPKSDDGSKKFADIQGNLEQSVTHLSSRLVTQPEKNGDVKISVEDQPGSSSECVEEYLSEPAEGDCTNSANSGNPDAKQFNHMLESSEKDLTSSNYFILKSDDKNDITQKVDVLPSISDKTEDETQGQLPIVISRVKMKEEQNIGNDPCGKFTDVGSDWPVDHASKRQFNVIDAQIAQPHEDSGDNGRAPLREPIKNIMQHDNEAVQIQRGVSRRCLQFEEAQQENTLNNHSPNLTNNTSGSKSPASTTELENLDASHQDISALSSKRHMINLAALFPQYNGKSSSSGSKPSGIGLHLNSIVKNLPMDHTATASIASAPIISCSAVENRNSCSNLSNAVKNVTITAEERMVKMKSELAASSSASGSLLTMEYFDNIPIEHQITPYNTRSFTPEDCSNLEQLNPSSPKKKRKKLSSNDGDGCKRCNCKKSQCLKLYCDCFAAGIYCADPCACQGCLNRPEYEDTVLETRQQIESRNPHAFAPKIVQRTADLPAMIGDDGNQFTPSSARHKRGCNCKRSMCLKKYCECYQANVGCSSGCRCEGCKNVYGRKEDYMMTEEIVNNRARDERLVATVNNKLEMAVTDKNFLDVDLYDLENLTPLTPSFHHSDNGKDTSKSRFTYGRYLLSPDSDLSMLPSYSESARSPQNAYSNDVIPENTKQTMDIGPYSRGADYNIAEMMDQFSPKCDALDDICDLSPLPNPSSLAIASSASFKTIEWSNRLQLYPRSGRLSSGSSLRWRGSPITPMTRLGETKTQVIDSGTGSYNIVDNDTPELFKEASTPNTSVKVSSPNKKRVSPPHGQIQELRRSSSGGLKSGRKFILKAVPAFPPLTPCADSKGRTNQKD